ncbi:MAG TPA: GNAT family N-acetyltransferase [Anaerolineaceae bacterium]|nr:GNAT family N-acetyltransferase [Anaerolineaceae bacterium]
MTNVLTLRNVKQEDLAVFFANQMDEDADFMAAFTSQDRFDKNAFDAHWNKIMHDPTVHIRTILVDDGVAGYVLSYEEEGRPEVSYWLGKDYWGRGLATGALRIFLQQVNATRPIYARTAKDNQASRRVLEKCGFKVIAESEGFSNARGKKIPELLLVL